MPAEKHYPREAEFYYRTLYHCVALWMAQITMKRAAGHGGPRRQLDAILVSPDSGQELVLAVSKSAI